MLALFNILLADAEFDFDGPQTDKQQESDLGIF